jgi:hypothetical protein
MVDERTEKMMEILREQGKQEALAGKPDVGKIILGSPAMTHVPWLGMYGRKKELIRELVEDQVEEKYNKELEEREESMREINKEAFMMGSMDKTANPLYNPGQGWPGGSKNPFNALGNWIDKKWGPGQTASGIADVNKGTYKKPVYMANKVTKTKPLPTNVGSNPKTVDEQASAIGQNRSALGQELNTKGVANVGGK